MFGSNGQIQTDVQKWAGSYYYFDHNTYLRCDNAYLQSRWGDYYLFGNNGHIQTDVQKWAGTYYYFDHNTFLRRDNAYLKSRWGNWYLFGNGGRIVSGFANWYNDTYYFDPATYVKRVNSYINNGGNTYWLDANGAMRTRNWQIETAIANGRALVGRSPYNWGGGRTPASIAQRSFDCSSFIHYLFSTVGINLGDYRSAVTFSEAKLGHGVAWNNIRRGDIFFMDQINHVGIYLGNGLFLHDSPNSPTGGVGISNVNEAHWANLNDRLVRRIVG